MGVIAPILGGALSTIALNIISNIIAAGMTPKAPPLPTKAGSKAIVDPRTNTYRWLNLRTGKLNKGMFPLPTAKTPSKLVQAAKGVKGVTGAILDTAMHAAPIALATLGNATQAAGAAAGPAVDTGLKMALKAPAAMMPNISQTNRELFGTIPGDNIRNLAGLADDVNVGKGIGQGAMAAGQGLKDIATQIQLINIHKQLMGDTNSLGKQLRGMHLTPAELNYMEQVMRTMNPVGRSHI